MIRVRRTGPDWASPLSALYLILPFSALLSEPSLAGLAGGVCTGGKDGAGDGSPGGLPLICRFFRP